MKKFIIIFFLIIILFDLAFSHNINNTGICYDKVQVSKKASILNPSEMVYEEYKEHLTFKHKNPF